MFTAKKKIQKSEGEAVTPFEESVAQAFFDLEQNSSMKAEMSRLYFTSAKKFEMGDKSAICVFVPFPLLETYHKIHQDLVQELEKRFSGQHVVIIGQRRILPVPGRRVRSGMKWRARSRTLTSVHESILEDIVYPAEIVGKRCRTRVNGSRLYRVFLDAAERNFAEGKIDTFRSVYRKLTGKDAVISFGAADS